jgi:hypothetical protein
MLVSNKLLLGTGVGAIAGFLLGAGAHAIAHSTFGTGNNPLFAGYYGGLIGALASLYGKKAVAWSILVAVGWALQGAEVAKRAPAEIGTFAGALLWEGSRTLFLALCKLAGFDLNSRLALAFAGAGVAAGLTAAVAALVHLAISRIAAEREAL